MEWAVLFFTIVLSVVAIVTTVWCGRKAGERLEEMKAILSKMDKEVLKEMKGTLEEIRRGVHHLVEPTSHKHKSKHEHK